MHWSCHGARAARIGSRVDSWDKEERIFIEEQWGRGGQQNKARKRARAGKVKLQAKAEPTATMKTVLEAREGDEETRSRPRKQMEVGDKDEKTQ
ncbi:hypothetical protein NDU88_000898 [Pleurodeles waltl]|uniref:Uncharacterized protein n=1 Tax=Pleurodeles waltl TaxID=8319 RepID=A0AAV7WGU3_PLEWA|nr:hypothetical protein NDU88_000898 [Pleurodeles waltl]